MCFSTSARFCVRGDWVGGAGPCRDALGVDKAGCPCEMSFLLGVAVQWRMLQREKHDLFCGRGAHVVVHRVEAQVLAQASRTRSANVPRTMSMQA